MALKIIQPYRVEENLVEWLRRLVDSLSDKLDVEDWHEIGASGEPAFENSWVNRAGAWDTAAFYKDPFGIVHLKGSIDSGTSTVSAFTLPTGYRPSLQRQFPARHIASNTLSGIIIATNGTVNPISGTADGIPLDGITFKATE